MSLSLTTFSTGSTIDATTLRARLASIEDYLNEGILAADRGSAWCDSTQLYRPDFHGGATPRTTFSSGETYYHTVGTDTNDRLHYEYHPIRDTRTWIPGLTITFQLPESLAQGSVAYRVGIFASFYAYEYGGAQDPAGLVGNDSQSAAAQFEIGGQNGPTATPWFESQVVNISTTSYLDNTGPWDYWGAYWVRKQVNLMAVDDGTQFTGAGVKTAGVTIRLFRRSNNEVKHVFIDQRNILVRYYLR